MVYYQKWKYGNSKKTVVNGIRYDSKFEGSEAKDLELLKKAGEIKDFQAHYKIPLKINGFLIANYYVDFRIEHNDGTIEYRETKGWPITEVWKMKWKILEAQTANDPDVKLNLVMQKSFKMRKIKKAA